MGWEICKSVKIWQKLGPQISIFRIAPFFYSTNLRWILAFSSSTFHAFSARTWRLRSLSSIQVSSDLSSYVLASFRRVHAPPPWWRLEDVIKAAPHGSARLMPLRWPSRWPCGEEPEEKENPFELFAETEILAEDCLGHESQTIFRQNLSFGEQLKRVLFFFRLFARGLATLDRAVRSHTHHIINKHAPNLTQDLAHQPLLPLTPKRLSHSPSKKTCHQGYRSLHKKAMFRTKEKEIAALVSMLKLQELTPSLRARTRGGWHGKVYYGVYGLQKTGQHVYDALRK